MLSNLTLLAIVGRLSIIRYYYVIDHMKLFEWPRISHKWNIVEAE